MRLALWIVCLIALCGCVPCSDSPLSPPGGQALDPALMGTWAHTEGDSTVTLHFGLDADTNLLTIVMTETDMAGKLDSSRISAHTTRAGERSYLNVRFGDEKAPEPGYLFVKYTIKGDSLGIGIISAEAVTKAIESGEIEGETTQGQWTSSIRVKDTPEKLLLYLDKHDAELFPEMQFFQKLQAAPAAAR